MAIVFEQPKRRINWFPIVTSVFGVLFIIALAYYLFFAPTPNIEAVLPEVLEKTNRISDLEFTDPTLLLSSAAYKALRVYVGAPSSGTLGRTNPFLPL